MFSCQKYLLLFCGLFTDFSIFALSNFVFLGLFVFFLENFLLGAFLGRVLVIFFFGVLFHFGL